MAAKTTAMANSFLKLVLQAATWTSVAINATASPYTNTYATLHSSNPGASGDQTTNEISYTSYARQAVARTSGGWTVTNNVANPAANIVFPMSTGGTPTATHFGVGSDVSGAGNLWWFGTVTPNIVVSTVVTQTLTNASTITET